LVAPSFLEAPAFRKWLDGGVPAWTLLDQRSLEALRGHRRRHVRPIRLAADLSADEIAQSAVARNVLVLLRAMSSGGGLQLTATGNLSRRIVAEMIDLIDWPGFDKAEDLRFFKVVNEPDFLPLYFLRHVAQAARLVRKRKGFLTLTLTGRQVLEDPVSSGLQALLFHIALSGIDLGYLGRDLYGDWPQHDIGILLWSLSVAANDWQSPQRLTRLCTIPTDHVVEAQSDLPSLVTEARILKPLWWFGLLEHRHEEVPGRRFAGRHFYRKAPLFDRFLAFDVTLEQPSGHRH
jgi:hypothetical protein